MQECLRSDKVAATRVAARRSRCEALRFPRICVHTLRRSTRCCRATDNDATVVQARPLSASSFHHKRLDYKRNHNSKSDALDDFLHEFRVEYG